MSSVDCSSLTSSNCHYDIGEPVTEPKAFRCYLAILRESDGSFSAIVLNLPGVGSCGHSQEEAVNNAKEAAKGAIESYLEDEEEIPWVEEFDIPEGAIRKLVLVD